MSLPQSPAHRRTPMHRPKRWNIPTADPAAAADLGAHLKTSPLLAQVLINRGFTEPAACAAFLRPSLSDLLDPSGLPNLRPAAERIARAIRDREPIVVYGDYDVDGITATSILWHAIILLGGTVSYYIPHRVDEGYGLNEQAIRRICDRGARLIVTVDCGVTATGPAAAARQCGVDLIVTDHHEWHERDGAPDLPECCAIVHPRLPTDAPAYANPHLCGAGVAFKLAWGIGQAVNGGAKVDPAFREFLVEATALAALGTIADVVPLVGENRVLAHFGLGGLKQSKLRGIRALIESANLTGQKLDSYHVGFLLGPRLNACGRMDHARLAVELLTDADEPRAAEIAAYLEGQNRARQEMERGILKQALDQVAQRGMDREDCPAIVLGAPGWHPGVIGIVASRLVDRFHRPTIVIATANGHGQGSGRSIPGFHLAEALRACAGHLQSHGGHEMAAGLKIDTDRLDDFAAAFAAYAARTLAPEQLLPELVLEAVADLSAITEPLVADLKRLAPFGQANRRPLLCVRDAEVAAPPRRVGKNADHLQLRIRQGSTTMKCVGFGMGELLERLPTGTRIDLAVEPALSEYLGRTTVELQIRDVRWH